MLPLHPKELLIYVSVFTPHKTTQAVKSHKRLVICVCECVVCISTVYQCVKAALNPWYISLWIFVLQFFNWTLYLTCSYWILLSEKENIFLPFQSLLHIIKEKVDYVVHLGRQDQPGPRWSISCLLMHWPRKEPGNHLFLNIMYNPELPQWSC